MATFLWILAFILVLAGIIGIVLPALPGTFMVFLGLLLAAWIDDFQKVGWLTITLLGVLTIISLGMDFLATSIGARRTGASKKAILGATLGTVIGLFFGLLGILFGPFAGAVIGEYLARRDVIQAGRAGFGAWLGLVLGTAVKLALAFTMIGVFITAYMIDG